MQPHRKILRVVTWIAIAAFGTNNVLAGAITLATTPLVTGLGKTVAPNIFFVLDDSLSMNDEFLPDSVQDDYGSGGSDANPCALNFGYNTIYYNPSTTYSPPLNADGTSYADAPFAAAKGGTNGGFSSSSSIVNLSLSSPVYTTLPATGTITLGSNPIATSNGSKTITFTHVALTDGHLLAAGDQVLISGVTGTGNPQKISGIPITNVNTGAYVSVASVSGSTKFTITVSTAATATSTGVGGTGVKIIYKYQSGSDANYYYYSYTANPSSPSSTCQSNSSYTRVPAVGQTWTSAGITAAQQTNFANWYSYYRTRLLMMKSASGRAFAPVAVTGQYRVGFTVISDKTVTGSSFLDIAKFTNSSATGQVGKWYATLYGTAGASYTPLRGALSKAGRYFAGKFADSSGNHDPVQYSCQKNFTIMATDGSWNANSESPTSDTGTPGTASNNYGPFQVDNLHRVGDQDGATGVASPYYDSSHAQNTLADVAYYYYNTDLRPTSGNGGLADDGVTRSDVSTNDVPTSNSDPANWQHMTTFTLGLGLSGTLANPGDYSAIVASTKNWPDPIVTTSPSSIQDTRRIDDLWHAAVNGHGIDSTGANLSAKNPDAVVNQLSKALQSITAVVGSSSAAATSNLQPVSGDNTAFIAQYKTVAWTGDVVARTIDVITGAIPTTNVWSAQTLLDSQATRSIYTFSTGASNHLRAFTYANLTTTEKTYFNSSALTQYAGWSSAQQTAASQSAVVDYVRGVRTNEGPNTTTSVTDLFRQREHVLGDIVDAAPVFVRKPPFAYTDPGYATFLANQASRLATVYVGANDGMLHAFDGSTGQSGSGKERWAYIPSMVIPNLYKLAASNYSLNHGFYVDGPIIAGDAYDGSNWATILVGGLGGGGKGYYALDVTDPANPKALWEFGTAQDADVGYSYGNPIITKRASDGKWVVIFTSGYDNSTGDKKGHLFVVDAFTGAKLSDITTTTTANEDLSGIGRISNYVESGLQNNVTQYVYGGDLNGSLWRFDINAATAQHLADTSTTAGAQPITVRPELAKINSSIVVYFGTGRYLSLNDVTTAEPSTSVAQAIYAVKDTNTYLGVLTTSGANLVSQTLSTTTSPFTSTNTTVDWTMNNGWYVTTPVGERFNVDPGLQLGTLVIAANIPNTSYCQPTGSSVLYQLSYNSGFVLTTNVFQAQIVGNTQLQLGGSGGSGSVVGGKIVIESVLADGTTMNTDQQNAGGAAGSVKRISWREIE